MITVNIEQVMRDNNITKEEAIKLIYKTLNTINCKPSFTL